MYEDRTVIKTISTSLLHVDVLLLLHSVILRIKANQHDLTTTFSSLKLVRFDQMSLYQMYIHRFHRLMRSVSLIISNQHHKHSCCVANFAHFLQTKQMMLETSQESPPAIESLFCYTFMCFLIHSLMLMSLTLNSHPSKTPQSLLSCCTSDMWDKRKMFMLSLHVVQSVRKLPKKTVTLLWCHYKLAFQGLATHVEQFAMCDMMYIVYNVIYLCRECGQICRPY